MQPTLLSRWTHGNVEVGPLPMLFLDSPFSKCQGGSLPRCFCFTSRTGTSPACSTLSHCALKHADTPQQVFFISLEKHSFKLFFQTLTEECRHSHDLLADAVGRLCAGWTLEALLSGDPTALTTIHLLPHNISPTCRGRLLTSVASELQADVPTSSLAIFVLRPVQATLWHLHEKPFPAANTHFGRKAKD